jgi:hypothetical protein
MLKRVKGLAVAASFAVAGLVQAAPIKYHVALSEELNKLTGSITTDGTIGVIRQANILSWSFNSQGTAVYDISSDSPLNFFSQTDCFGANGCFLASPAELRLSFSSIVQSPDDPGAFFQVVIPPLPSGLFVRGVIVGIGLVFEPNGTRALGVSTNIDGLDATFYPASSEIIGQVGEVTNISEPAVPSLLIIAFVAMVTSSIRSQSHRREEPENREAISPPS